VTEWTFETNASWLQWDGTAHDIHGTPDNGDVGSYWVRLHITDGIGHSDEHNFTLVVANTRPNISTTDIKAIDEDSLYSVDYDSDDDGQGTVTWHLATDSSWLDLNVSTGNLTGVPTNDDVGEWWANVSVDDGNGGWDHTNFTITVSNTNDPPVITTTDIVNATEDVAYNVSYSATDVDIGASITWTFASNASWLNTLPENALVYGLPDNSDVSVYWVNVTATDEHGAFDSHNFTLTVHNTNDAPVLSGMPVTTAKVLFEYRYQVQVKDDDIADVITFELLVSPEDMEVDPNTGVITWMPTLDDEGVVPVTVGITDGTDHISFSYNITVTVPLVSLTSPEDASEITVATPELVWNFPDNDTGIVYDIFLGTDENMTEPFIEGHNRTRYKLSEDLEENITYYWWIVPRAGDITGKASDVRTFKVKMGTITHIIRMDLSKSDLTMERKGSTSITVTLYNDGQQHALIDLTLDTSFPISALQMAPQVLVPPGESRTLLLNISVPKDVAFGQHEIIIKAKAGDTTVTKTVTLKVEDTSTPTTITNIWEDPLFWAVLMLIMVAAVIGLSISYTRRKRAEADLQAARMEAMAVEDFVIDELFAIYKDGRMITHVSSKEAMVDKQIFSAMLVAIQSFVKESFDAEEGLTSFEFGSRKMILEKGNYIILVVALSGTEPKILKDQMKRLVQKVEGLYAGVVEDWDGEDTAFKGIEHMLVPIFKIKRGLKIKKEKEEVKIKSGIEFYSGYVRLKVAVKNELSARIKDIKLRILYDKKTLRLSHIEPDYAMKGDNVLLDDIGPNEKRTVAFYLDPLICQESNVNVTASFRDEYDNPGEANMKQRPVDIVCPIFYTPENVNVAMLKRLMGEVKYKDSRIYDLPYEVHLEEAFELAKEAIQRHDVKFVREFSERGPYIGEAWYYGQTSETEEELVIRASVMEERNILEIFVGCSNLAIMTGLLAELGNNINTIFEERGLGRMEPNTDPDIDGALENIRRLIDKMDRN
jgi:hypothetical protein